MSNMIFDSHCHPQFPQYEKDRDEMIKRAYDAGVFLICVGTDYETSKQGIELAQKNEKMWATVGLHPNDNLAEKFISEEYAKLLKMPKVVAMGEIGLDFYRTEKEEDQKIQKDRFVEQLELAKKVGKPLVLHCRDSRAGSTGRAYPQMFDVLRNCYADKGGVVHSYTGSLDEAKKFLDLGLRLGFNGIITFARQYDEIVKYTPLDRILLETDAPYLMPEPLRSKPPAFAKGVDGRGRNEPIFVLEVAKKVAEIKNISVDEVLETTTRNCKILFSLTF